MKISKTAITLIVLGGAAFNIAMKASREGYESRPCSVCCEYVPALHPPFLRFEYWSELGTVLFVLSFGLTFAFFKVLIEENRKSDVLHITPTG